MNRKYWRYFLNPLWEENQILVAVLGICSALAVTVKVSVAFSMGLSVIFVTSLSCLLVSVLRKTIPDNVRMIAQLIIISLFVIIVDQFLKAFFYEISKVLSVFVGLIITNCIVMGRTESMARHQPPFVAFLDGLGTAVGYTIVIVIVGIIREIFGFGSLWNIQIIPQSWYSSYIHPGRYTNCNIMALAPSAFFILGGMIAIMNTIKNKQKM